MEIAATNGYSLQVLETCPREEHGKHSVFYLDRVKSRAIDGLIIVDSLVNNLDILHLKHYGIPFVIVNNLIESVKGRSVIENNREIGYNLAKALLDRGHHRIGYFGVARNFIESSHQLEGIYKAIGEAGCGFSDRDMIVPDGRPSEAGVGFLYMKEIIEMLSSEDYPQAIICGNSIITNWFIEVLHMGGLACRDKIEFAGRLANPEYCISKNCVYAATASSVQWGVEAARLLLDIIEGKPEPLEPKVMNDVRYFTPKHRLDGVFT